MTDSFDLSSSQKEYGISELRRISTDLGVSDDDAIRILLNVQKIKDFWNWVNAEDFLESYHKIKYEYLPKEASR